MKTVTVLQCVRQMADAWNAKSQADGHLLEEDPSSLPPLYLGAIFDIPRTPEAEERLRHLDASSPVCERKAHPAP